MERRAQDHDVAGRLARRGSPPTPRRPATHATRSRAVRRAAGGAASAGTLRSVNRSWSVFVPSMPSGRMRSPSRHARTTISSPSAAASSVARSGPSGEPAGRAQLGAAPPTRPNRQRPGTVRARPARARRPRPTRSGSAPARRRAQPAAEVDLAALGLAGRGARSPRACPRPSGTSWPATRSASARSARRRRPGSASAQRLGADRDRPRGRRRPPRESRRRPGRAARASSASSARVSAMFRSAAGLTSRSAGSTSWRIRLRAKLRVEVGRVVGERKPRLGRQQPRSSARSIASSGRTTRPLRGGRPSSARVPGEDASR